MMKSKELTRGQGRWKAIEERIRTGKTEQQIAKETGGWDEDEDKSPQTK